jgi:hypothetical protein
VTEIEPHPDDDGGNTGTQATTFKVVVVLDESCRTFGLGSPARPTSRRRPAST